MFRFLFNYYLLLAEYQHHNAYNIQICIQTTKHKQYYESVKPNQTVVTYKLMK